MPPNQDEAVIEEFAITEPTLNLTPLLQTPQSSEASFSLSTDTDSSINLDPGIALLFSNIRIPFEQNLRELLLRVTETDDLKNVTQVKLRVIARDVSLQHLNIYTPILRELTLDGSVISSLRDLGCKLKCLKILRVNRCGLTSFDGLFGLETLEELHAGYNNIENVSPCSHLPEIKLIDVRNNYVTKFTSISFLSLCDTLRHLVLSGNQIADKPNYRKTIKKYIPKLLTLDNASFTNNDETTLQDSDDSDEDDYNQNINVCLSELEPISLDDNAKSSLASTSLPPINLHSANRPATAEYTRKKTTDKTLRPFSTSTLPKTKIISQLPDISHDKKSSPSSLTSGEPICGNIAVSLRNRLKLHEAWPEKKS